VQKSPFLLLALLMLGLLESALAIPIYLNYSTNTINYLNTSTYIKGPTGVQGNREIMVSWNFNYSAGTYPFTTPADTYPFVDGEYYAYGLKWLMLNNDGLTASDFAQWVRTYHWTTASGYRSQTWYHNGTVSDRTNRTGTNVLAARYLTDLRSETGNSTYTTWAQEAWNQVMTVYETQCDAFWANQRPFYATINPVGSGLNAGLAAQIIYEHRGLINTGFVNNTILTNLANALANNFYDSVNGGWFYNRTCQNQPIDLGKDLHDMGWNIAALVYAYRILGNTTYLTIAQQGANKIIEKLWNAADGSFNSRCFNNDWTNCESAHDLYFQSTIIFGLALLYSATKNLTYYHYAKLQFEYFITNLWLNKGFRFSTGNNGISIGENMWLKQAIDVFQSLAEIPVQVQSLVLTGAWVVGSIAGFIMVLGLLNRIGLVGPGSRDKTPLNFFHAGAGDENRNFLILEVTMLILILIAAIMAFWLGGL